MSFSESSSSEIGLAWQRYLAATRSCPEGEYEAAEEAAWTQLLEELATVGNLDPGAAPHPLARSQGRQ